MSYAAVVNGGSQIGNIFDRSLTGGFLVHALFTPILTLVLTLESKGRAVCGNAARTDLCGVVSRTRSSERDAVSEMKEEPSESACRRRLQTAISCCRPMTVVVNVMEKA